ncbi:MAG TPA: hypothetical protein VJ256_05875 [Dehalococcoidia bacterium]|nr:hypothetical protein [Dehalococcoidia bacterium]
MLRKYSAGQSVPGGVYWNKQAWELVTISEDGDSLPGEGVTYYQVPVLLAIGLGPVAGLAFILVLPLLVPFLAVYAVGKAIARRIPGRAGSGREKEAPATP